MQEVEETNETSLGLAALDAGSIAISVETTLGGWSL